MATRSSATRRVPGNPLAGILRQTARAARSTTRRSASIPGPAGEPGLPGLDGTGAMAVAVIRTDAQGVAAWSFAESEEPPVVVAVVAETTVPVLVTVATVGTTYADFMTWSLDGQPARDVVLHVAAFGVPVPERPPVDLPEQPEQEGT